MSATAVVEREAQSVSRQGETAGQAGRDALVFLLPAGRRVPRGTLRWYPVRVPEGREAAEAARAAKLLSPAAAEDAFPAWREKWVKRGGAWQVRTEPLFRGYFLVPSRDAVALRRELARMGVRCEAPLVPLSDEACAWYAAAMDGQRVVRASTGVIEGGVLRVQAGPLMGRESSVCKVDRHKRSCTVRLQVGWRVFTERLALNVPTKS